MKRSPARFAGLLLALATTASAGIDQFFRVPFPAVRADPGPAAARDVLTQLEDAATRWAGRADAGYDWVVPRLCAGTAAAVVRRLDSGEFTDPGLVRAMLVQFHEIYAANALAHATGERPARHWRQAFALSQAMTHVDAADSPRRKLPAMTQVVSTLYAHMLTDLPLVLAILEREYQPTPDPEALRRAFREVEDIFGEVMAAEFAAGELTPQALAKAWPKLPGWVQGLMAGNDTPFSLAEVFLRVRRLAWVRFRWLRRKRDLAPRVAALEPWRGTAALL